MTSLSNSILIAFLWLASLWAPYCRAEELLQFEALKKLFAKEDVLADV